MGFFTKESKIKSNDRTRETSLHGGKVIPFFRPQLKRAGNNSKPVIQRTPFDGSSRHDPIHDPIIEQFRRETESPLMPDDLRQSDAYIKYVLAPEYFSHRRSTILNTYSFTDPLYAQIIAGSPDQTPLWPSLMTRTARINFIRFLIREDPTNCRPYDAAHLSSSSCAGVEHNQEVFTNLCMGFATQFYVRHTYSPTRLSSAEVTRLQDVGHIYAGAMLPKFRVPVFLAIYPGHAFNAFLIEFNASDINSYLFLEPQNDQLFTANDPLFTSYFSQGMITIDRLTGFGETGQYQTTVEHTFAERGGAPVHASVDASQRMALSNLSSALRIAYDPDSWRYTIDIPQTTFEAHFRGKALLYSDDILVVIFPFLNGRRFKRSPASTEEILNRTIFLDLVGRSSLEQTIRR